MRDYFDEEDFDDQDDLTFLIMEKEKETKERKEFIQNCRDAYEVIQKDPDSIFEPNMSQDKKVNLISAINRMSGLFILEENYEKCKVLKSFLESRVPGEKLSPRVDEVKKFLGQ